MHAAESAGAGLYSYDINVSGIVGEVYGQYAHFSRVLNSGNKIRITERTAFSVPFRAFIDIASDNAAITINANLNGRAFSTNIFDCRYAIYGDTNTAIVKVRNPVWENTNIIGIKHAVTGRALNLCKMNSTLVNNSKIDFRLSLEDLSMFSVLYFSSTCIVTWSVILISPDE